jgi:hypothetical protein
MRNAIQAQAEALTLYLSQPSPPPELPSPEVILNHFREQLDVSVQQLLIPLMEKYEGNINDLLKGHSEDMSREIRERVDQTYRLSMFLLDHLKDRDPEGLRLAAEQAKFQLVQEDPVRAGKQPAWQLSAAVAPTQTLPQSLQVQQPQGKPVSQPAPVAPSPSHTQVRHPSQPPITSVLAPAPP